MNKKQNLKERVPKTVEVEAYARRCPNSRPADPRNVQVQAHRRGHPRTKSTSLMKWESKRPRK
jgi:hypothetical protein